MGRIEQAHVVAIWALPCAQDERRIQPIIDDLAEATGGARFTPHLSLGALKEPLTDYSDIWSKWTPFTLQPVGLDGNETFTTSFFLRCAPTPALLAMRKSLEVHPLFRRRRRFDPHLSLCYGPPPPGAFERKDTQALLSASIRFDRVCAVQLPIPIETHDHVRSWSTIATKALGPV